MLRQRTNTAVADTESCPVLVTSPTVSQRTPRTSRTFFHEISEELVSRSYELIPYKPDTRHVTSRQTEHRRCAPGCFRFSSPRGVRAKDRNKTCDVNCNEETRFPTGRLLHACNRFSEIRNYKVVDNCRFIRQ